MVIAEKKRHILTACGIFAFALALRISFDLYLKTHYPFYDHPSGDVSYYLNWARAIALGDWEGQRAFIGLPLFPHFLGILYRLCLGNLLAMRMAMMALGAINCALVYVLAQRLFNYRIALASGILAAISFTCMYYDQIIMPPTLIIFLTSVILLCLLERQAFKLKHWFLIGTLLGLCLLGDGKFLFFVGFLIHFLAKENPDLKRMFKGTMAPLCAGILLMLVISGGRNYLTYSEWIWISPQSGLSLFAGNNPQAKGYFENMDEIRPTHFGQDVDQILLAQAESGKTLSRKEVSAHYRQKAVNFIIKEPAAFSQLLVKKMGAFLREIEASYDDLDLIFLRQLKWRLDINPVTLVLPLAVLGMMLTWRTAQARLLMFLVASQIIVILIFFFVNRFRASIFPFLIVYEVVAIDWLIQKIKTRQLLPALAAFAFVLACLIINQPRPIDAATFDHLFLSKKGFILEQKGERSMALVAYRQALALRPRDTTLLFNLGNVHLNLSEFKDAKDYYRKTIEINPLYIDAYVNLGYASEMDNDHAGAVKAYTKALQLSPSSADVAMRLGSLYAAMGRCDEAAEILNTDLRHETLLQHDLRLLLNTCINN